MNKDEDKSQYSEDEIAARMNRAVRRALNTSPTPAKEFIGKSERAIVQRETRKIRKARQSEPKVP
jgi:hypothetical protein